MSDDEFGSFFLAAMYWTTAGGAVLAVAIGGLTGAPRLGYAIGVPMFSIAVAIALVYKRLYGGRAAGETIAVGEVVDE